MKFSGKTIVVTGASGIGAAGARRLASEGAKVLVLSRDAEQCAELVGSLEGEGYRWVAVDLSDRAATARSLEEAAFSMPFTGCSR